MRTVRMLIGGRKPIREICGWRHLVQPTLTLSRCKRVVVERADTLMQRSTGIVPRRETVRESVELVLNLIDPSQLRRTRERTVTEAGRSWKRRWR